jgi:hypothetical protein
LFVVVAFSSNMAVITSDSDLYHSCLLDSPAAR